MESARARTDGDDPAEGEDEGGPVVTALGTSVRGNSTAFGFSIMITISFGALQSLAGSPSLTELLAFGVAAAIALALLEGAVSRGFVRRVGSAPAEVAMLGTAMNFASVAAGVGAAIAVGELWTTFGAWPAGAFCAAVAYVLAESAEMLIAERVQRSRGDPEAEHEQSE